MGEKTAVKLLQQFGGIDNMLAHTDEIKGALSVIAERIFRNNGQHFRDSSLPA